VVSASHATGEVEERFTGTYGLAFSGSFLAGYVIREVLSEVLSQLQFIAPNEFMTIEQIMRIVHAFHKFYTVRVRESFKLGHDLDFLIGGLCPATTQTKVFRFVASEDDDPHYSEVLTALPFAYSAIGADEDRFRELIENDLAHPPCAVNFAVFRRLRDIIRDPNFPSVDGRLQTGSFENGRFELFGVMEHDLSGAEPRALPSVRGVIIDEIYEGHDAEDFFISYSFKAPFQEDLEHLFREK
jgi:hypothetical protein